MRCNIQQSPQQVLFNLYNTITLAELKGYTMVQFSYMLLKLYKKGNNNNKIEYNYKINFCYNLKAILKENRS